MEQFMDWGEKKVKVLDGGFSTQLKNYVSEPVDGDPLWTAKFLATKPDKCVLVHRDFVMAGADVITTATYQASIEGFKSILNIPEDTAMEIMTNSVQLARDGIVHAFDKIGKLRKVEIAGSVGPYGAYLHDGSEYNGCYCSSVSEETLMNYHRPRIEALLEGGVDYLAVETIPCIKEALAVIKVLEEFPHARAWISFSIKDSKSISSGENFCEAAVKCWAASTQLVAVGANCFHPSLVSKLFKPLREMHPHIPTIVYPNNGDRYDVFNKSWTSRDPSFPEDLEEYIPEWLALGICMIGGCCRTNSKNIANIAALIK